MHGATKALQRLPAENDFGNVEYKLRLKEPLPANRFHQLVTQMKYRLSEGAGECFYYVGAPLRLRALSDACAQGSPAGHTTEAPAGQGRRRVLYVHRLCLRPGFV